jgi:hypothetical protein
MCWVLYLACDQRLPLQPFDREAPAFNIAELTPREEPVRGQFSKPYVYRVGAHTLCGCGFDRGQANPDHPEELETTEASLRRLHAYLSDALGACRNLELYACWDGDQGAVPDHRWNRRLSDFGSRMRWFPDRTFIEVSAGTG